MAVSVLTPSISVDASSIIAYHSTPKMVTELPAEQYFDDEGELKVSYFNYLLETSGEKEAYKLIFTINSLKDMQHAIEKINEKLPTRVEFQSGKYDNKTLKRMYNEIFLTFTGSKLNNLNTLANYREQLFLFKFVLNDNSSQTYSARQIERALDLFTTALADTVRSDNEEQSLINLYNYLYKNFKYNADSFRNMIVGNLGNGELACNGFSRLANETLIKLGIKSEIRQGYSHFWNIVYLDGKQTTFDITTDIVLKNRYLTLGNSTGQHKLNTSSVNFYNADYSTQIYDIVASHSFANAPNY